MPGPVVITGGTGFVGRRVTAAFSGMALAGQKIYWLARDDNGSPLPPDSGQGPIFRKIDLESAGAVDRLIADIRPEIVLHLAAQASPAQAEKNGDETWRLNFLASMRLAESVARHAPEATFVFASSAEVYGSSFNDGPASEETPARPMNIYARSKLAAEYMLGDVLPRTARLVVMRPTNHTGPGQDTRFALSAFAEQIAAAEAGSTGAKIRVGNLESSRDILDVEDVARAYASVMANAARLPSRALYNLGSGQARTMRSLLDLMKARARREILEEFDESRARAGDIAFSCVRSDRLRAAIGWAPEIPIERTIETLLDAWRARVK